MRLISLSVRLFANILAGHLLLLFMGGGLAVLLGLAALGVAHLPDGLRLLRLRGRPGRDAAGVHLLDPDRDLHRRRSRRKPLERNKQWTGRTALIAQSTEAVTDAGVTDAGKAIALGIGAGLGSIGAGIGVGFIFGKEIESVARQPEMKDELQQIRWLGFALTEAVAFYTFIFGLIAFFL